jgi:hypothetical protein
MGRARNQACAGNDDKKMTRSSTTSLFTWQLMNAPIKQFFSLGKAF